MRTLRLCLQKLQRQIEKPFYFLFLSVFAFLDSLVFFIPIDGLLVTSVFAYPRAWFRNAVGVTLGSVLGSLLFAFSIEFYGLALIHTFLPSLEGSQAWINAAKLMNDYGIYAIFLIALSPLPQPPIVALAALGNVPLGIIGISILTGRLIKYLIMARLVAKSPALIGRLGLIQKEVEAAKKITNS